MSIKPWWYSKEKIKNDLKYGSVTFILSLIMIYFLIFDKVQFKDFIILTLLLEVFLYVIIVHIFIKPVNSLKMIIIRVVVPILVILYVFIKVVSKYI